MIHQKEIHAYKLNNMKFIKVLTSLIFLSKFALCQFQKPIGLYKGFAGTDAGYFYFNKDSSFIFCASKLKSNQSDNNKNLTFNDTIIKYGHGKWQKNDGLFILNFFNNPVTNINHNKINYKSSSKEPYDSLLLNIKVANIDINSPSMIVISFSSNKQSINSDNSGMVNLVLPLSYADSGIQIKKLLYEKQDIFLIPGNNFHDIELTLQKESASPISIKENISYHYKIKNNSDFFLLKPFIRDEGGGDKLRKIIFQNIKTFPERKYLFDFLLKELKS